MGKHITIVLPNKPGQFHETASILHKNNVNILGYGLFLEGRAGILHILCEPHQTALQVLQSRYSYYCTEKEVLIVEVEHKPGALQSVLNIIVEENINISTSYQGFTEKGFAQIVLEFDTKSDLITIMEILETKNFKIINN